MKMNAPQLSFRSPAQSRSKITIDFTQNHLTQPAAASGPVNTEPAISIAQAQELPGHRLL